MARRGGGGHFPVTVSDPDAGPIDRKTVRRVVATFRPYRARVTVVSGLIILTATLGIINPLLIKAVFDRALFGNPPGSCSGEACPNLPVLYFLVGLMVLVPIVTGLLGVGQTYLANVVGLRVMQDLRNKLYSHLQFMPLRFFTNTKTGEIQSRLANDVGGVQTVVTDTASSILNNIVVLISSLIAMFWLSWQLTVLSLCMVPLFVWLTFRVGKARRVVSTSTQQTMADISAVTEETLSVSGILLSKSFGRQKYHIDSFKGHSEKLAALQIRQQMIGRWFFMVISIFFSIAPAFVYLVAGLVMGNNTTLFGQAITGGTIVAFTTLQSRLFFPIGQMLQVSVEVQSSMALFERIFEYLDLHHDIQDADDALVVAPAQVRGEVTFERVQFRYESPVEVPPDEPVTDEVSGGAVEPEADGSVDDEGGLDQPAPASVLSKGTQPAREWTIDDVSLEIFPGQLAALVGPSGAGKTTLTYLVPRFYDVQEGAIKIDGTDVRHWSLGSLGEAIGIVTQETYLFHTTIRENLEYGRPGATEDELVAAAKAAFIHDRLMELPKGYDTVVGERGYKLSGGEKQRLAIARVILKDPRILILDEATSSLDSTSERLVQQALEPLMHGRTTIAIAHRLSTILSADVIFVVDRGRITERGTHAELLARGGTYAQLYEHQFKREASADELDDATVPA